MEEEGRWQDLPIFDESLPDPVFDRDSDVYRPSFGFVTTAEVLNGRAAMMGFFIVYFQELLAGKGVLQQYGLPYAEGAQIDIEEDAILLPPVVALVLAVIVVVAATYGGEFLGKLVGPTKILGVPKRIADQAYKLPTELSQLPKLELPKLPFGDDK
jgi:hypothetical protein